MTSLWAACAVLAVAASGALVVLVGLAMAYSDRDLRGFVEHAGRRSVDTHWLTRPE